MSRARDAIPDMLIEMIGLDAFGPEGTVESCTCVSCVSACTIRPGWFLPGEAEALAAKLGVPFDQLFREKLRIDLAIEDEDNGDMVAGLSPAVMPTHPGCGSPGGISPDPPYGVCVFLADNMRCSIHDLGKPYECRVALGHDEDAQGTDSGPRLKAEWSSKAARRQMTGLVLKGAR